MQSPFFALVSPDICVIKSSDIFQALSDFPSFFSSVFPRLRWHSLLLISPCPWLHPLISFADSSSLWPSNGRVPEGLTPGTLLSLLYVLPGPSHLCPTLQQKSYIYASDSCVSISGHFTGLQTGVPTWYFLIGVTSHISLPGSFSVFQITMVAPHLHCYIDQNPDIHY